MKIICNKEQLISVITPAMYTVSSKNTNLAIEGFKITADSTDNSVTICSYDLEKGVKIILSGEDTRIIEPGSVLVTATKFAQMIKNLPEHEVTLQTDEQFELTITSGRSEFTVRANDPTSFPVLPELSGESSFKIKQSSLRTLLNDTIFAVAVNNTRPALNGLLFDINNDILKVIACDGFRLAFRKEAGMISVENDFNASFIVPGKSITELLKLLRDSDEMIEIGLSRKHIIISIDNIVFFTRLIEGEFIDYKKNIPEQLSVSVNINKDDFIQSVERVSLIMDERNKSHVKLSFVTDSGVSSLRLSAATALGKVHDECDITKDGNDISIGMNSRYLIDTLRVIKDKNVVLKLESPIKVMLFYPEDDDSIEPRFIYLVVPVRMREDD